MNRPLILSVGVDFENNGETYGDVFVLRVNGEEILREMTYSSRSDDRDAEIWAANKLAKLLGGELR